MTSTSTALVLSNSKAKDWRRCPYLYKTKRIDGWKPKARKIQLERGSWIHDLLMHHYDGEDWRARHKVLTAQFNKLFDEEKEDLGPDLPDECARIMASYVAHYKNDEWHVVATELDEIIELPNGLKFRFIIDRIIEEDGGLWIVDTKTVAKFMSPEFLLLDAQLGRYFYCAELKGFKPLKGVIFDEVITTPPTVPAVLKNGQLSQRKNIRTDARTYLQAIRDNGLDVEPYKPFLRRLMTQDERFFKRTRLPKTTGLTRTLMDELMMTAREIQRAEKKGEFPRSPDRACSYCDYLVPCQIDLLGGDPIDELRAKFTRKNKEKEDVTNGK